MSRETEILLQLYLNFRAKKYTAKYGQLIFFLITYILIIIAVLIFNFSLFPYVFIPFLLLLLHGVYFFIGVALFQKKGVDIIGLSSHLKFRKQLMIKKIISEPIIHFENPWGIDIVGYNIYGNKKHFTKREILNVEVIEGYYVFNVKPTCLALAKENEISETLQKELRSIESRSIDVPLTEVNQSVLEAEINSLLSNPLSSYEKKMAKLYRISQRIIFLMFLIAGYIIIKVTVL